MARTPAERHSVASTTAITEQQRAALESNPWFAAMPDATRADIAARGRVRALAPGQRVFSRGEQPDSAYVVLDGVVRVSNTTSDGREHLLDFYGPGVWFGEVASLDGGPRMYDAEANGPAVVLQLLSSELEDLLARHPALSRALLRLEAQRLRIVLTALDGYSVQSTEQRLANRLLMLADHHSTKTARGTEIALALSQETLARLTGATRQRVNQIFKAWETDGLVEQRYGRVVLLDRPRLEKLASK